MRTARFLRKPIKNPTPFELRISVLIRAFLLLNTQKNPHHHLFSLRRKCGLSIDASLSNLIRQFHKGSYYRLHHVTSFFSICQQFFFRREVKGRMRPCGWPSDQPKNKKGKSLWGSFPLCFCIPASISSVIQSAICMPFSPLLLQNPYFYQPA